MRPMYILWLPAQLTTPPQARIARPGLVRSALRRAAIARRRAGRSCG